MRKALDLGQEVVPKTVRHTMATELRKRGVPALDIEGMLGHSATLRTSAVYAKYDPEYLGGARAALDAFWDDLAVHTKSHLRTNCGPNGDNVESLTLAK